MDVTQHNKVAWDHYVSQNDRWTIPVSAEKILQAKKDRWQIVLTPGKAVPRSWFPDLKGLKILGLACGGGQQGPILAALGANVTIFDNSEKQLLQDKKVSDKHNLNIKTVHGDMRNLKRFANHSFDLVFNPCSVLFVEDILPVWEEAFRVLKPNGILMSGLINPISFQINEENLKLIYEQPFSDLHSLPKAELEELQQKNEALSFGHSLTAQIGGQLRAGFTITGMYEDDWNGESKLDKYFPSFIATRAVKSEI